MRACSGWRRIFVWRCKHEIQILNYLTAYCSDHDSIRYARCACSHITVPRTFEVFDTLTVAGSIFVLLKGYRSLRWQDVILALVLDGVIGVGILIATLFSPYPFLGVVRSNAGQALLRGLFTAITTLGGLAIMRQGGPVQFHVANGNYGI